MTSRLTLSDILSQFKTELGDMYPENEIRNIGYLVAEQLLNYSKIDFHLKDKEPISPETAEKFKRTLMRLKNWEPGAVYRGVNGILRAALPGQQAGADSQA